MQGGGYFVGGREIEAAGAGCRAPETPMIRILGIDPGLGGALALLTPLGELTVEDTPLRVLTRGGKAARSIDAAMLARLVREMAPTHAAIERVGAMPGQGVTSMFSFGRSAGTVEGVLAALAVPVSYVSPQTWQRGVGMPKGQDGARARAGELLPAYAGRWPLKRHHGRADAALIAIWALHHLPLIMGAAAEA
ncbi:MAG TPA: hypothetical protein VMU87_16335 [Stellaceae bacterium]|nr:hypothetical protein [Stellaceae bacterium]